MSSLIYDAFFFELTRGKLDLTKDSFGLVLLTSSHKPNASHKRRCDLRGEVAAGGGYSAGGFSVEVSTQQRLRYVMVTLGGIVVPDSTITARYAAYFKASGDANKDILIALVDFQEDVTSDEGEWSLTDTVLKLGLTARG